MNTRPHKQSMSELKLRRLTEHNQRLREDLARPRVRVSEASARCVVAPVPFTLTLLSSFQSHSALQNDKRPSRVYPAALEYPARRFMSS